MLNNYLTQIDNFNKDHIDYETININKKYFNIYNNQILQPFQKFWFLIENTKFINSYNESNILRFGLNNKNPKIIKLLNYLKELINFIKILFDDKFDNIQINYPWKEYTNYPYLINFKYKNNTIFINEKKENLNINDITISNSYSLLFELSYIQLYKNNILKFNLSLIMIQIEPNLNLENCLLYDYTKNKINNKIQSYENINILHDDNKSINKNNYSNDKIITPFTLNLSDILNKKNTLKKIDNNQLIKNNQTEDKLNIVMKQMIDQKKILKKNSNNIQIESTNQIFNDDLESQFNSLLK